MNTYVIKLSITILLLSTSNIFALTTFKATDYVDIDTEKQILEAYGNAELKMEDLYISSNQILLHYITLDNLKNNLAKHSLENFKRIEANGNVNVLFAEAKLYGAQYIFDITKNIMVLNANKAPLFYESKKLKINATDRFEFNTVEDIIVARGSPHIQIFNEQTLNIDYELKAKLIYAKLNKDRKTIQHAEAFDNIMIVSTNQSVVTANYAYFNASNNTILIEDNVTLKMEKSILTGCKLVIDLNSGNSELIPCANQRNLSTTINLNNKP